MDLGKKMKQYRKLKGYTVSQMAEMMDVSSPTVTRWENGTIDIPSSVLLRYIQCLKVSYSDFFADDRQQEILPPEVRRVCDKVKKLPPDKLKVLEPVLDTWFKDS